MVNDKLDFMVYCIESYKNAKGFKLYFKRLVSPSKPVFSVKKRRKNIWSLLP